MANNANIDWRKRYDEMCERVLVADPEKLAAINEACGFPFGPLNVTACYADKVLTFTFDGDERDAEKLAKRIIESAIGA